MSSWAVGVVVVIVGSVKSPTAADPRTHKSVGFIIAAIVFTKGARRVEIARIAWVWVRAPTGMPNLNRAKR